jgi:hypothetical protein
MYIATDNYKSQTCTCGKTHRTILGAHECTVAFPGTKVVSIKMRVGPDGIRRKLQAIMTPAEYYILGEIDAEAGREAASEWHRW